MSGEPRPFESYSGRLGAGLAHDRLARLAARRVFVDLKHNVLVAAPSIDGAAGDWLRGQLRGAEQPEDLLLLRGPLFAGLAGNDDSRRQTRHSLRRSLDSLFPDSAPRSGFVSF